jgi:hypothetical protein
MPLTESYRPYGTSGLLTEIQALRTWLLSFCPYGTAGLLPPFQALLSF